MKRWMRYAVLGAALMTARVADAQPYNFLVDYFGNGTAQQAAGSDNIVGTNVQVGESFFWRISAIGGQWRTVLDSDQFPLMAFPVAECGDRIGDFTLNLFSGNTNVLSDVQKNSAHTCAHLGTNTVRLSSGLVFDRMELNFTLTGAVEAAWQGGDPSVQVGSTITSLLPFNGAPDQNPYFTQGGVVYENVVPEPATVVLMGLGLGVVGLVARRRRA